MEFLPPSSSSQPAKSAAAAAAKGEAEAAEGRRTASGVADQLGMVAKKARKERICTAKERISRMPPCAAGKRSSIYRGVTRHRWTGRYEAHLWDKSTWNQAQNKKGKQVYLGAYDDEEAAARAYDLAALKYWGAGTLINFPVNDYSRDLEEMQMVSKEDYLVSLRRKTSAFSRGFPKYRGIPRQAHSSNPWEASLNQMFGRSTHFNSLHCSTTGDAFEGLHKGGFCMERKIDLTGYIRWWGTKKSQLPDSSAAAATEFPIPHTEPFQLPSLGHPSEGGEGANARGSGVSALSILSRSAAFKKFEERLSSSSKGEAVHGKSVPVLLEDVGGGGPGGSGVDLGPSELLSMQRAYALASILSAPLSTSWSPIGGAAQEPGFWPNMVAPTRQSLQIPKDETNSAYTANPYEDSS